MPLVDTIRAAGQQVRIYSATIRGRPYWKLSYCWAGEWKQRTLRIAGPADEKRARAAARDLCVAMNQGRADGTTDFTKGVRTLRAAEDALSDARVPVDAAAREYAQASRILGGKATLLEAASFFAQQKLKIGPKIQLRDAVEQFIQSQEANRVSPKYLQDIRHRLRRFARDNPGNLSEIKSDQITAWLRGLRVAPRTRNNFLMLIKTFLHWARLEGLLPKNAPTEADDIPYLNAPTEIHIHSADTVAKLLQAAAEKAPAVVPYLALGYFAGVRPKEMERMTGANIRWDHGDVEVLPWQAKLTRRRSHRRLTPMQPNLVEWLTRYPVGRNERIANSWTRRRVLKLVTDLKIKWHHDVMRHSAISNLVALTNNVEQVALWAGNSRDIIYRSYLSQVTPAEAKQFFGIAPPKRGKIVRFG